MKTFFRPMPGLTIVTVIVLAILITLGTWQYQRLQWKTGLLAEVEQVADAPPFKSLNEVTAALKNGEPIDFRRIGLTGEHADMNREPYFVFTSRNRNISWRVFRPVRQNMDVVFASLQTIQDGEREGYESDSSAIVPVIGYVRLARGDEGQHTDSTPDKNRWFGFNPLPDTHNWADGVPGGADMRFYVDTVPGAVNANDLPARRPDIRNNHFDYMLTWYGLALVLLVIYLIMHRRAGRLGCV